MAGGAGLAIGSLLGGVLTNYLGWEWVFFVNGPSRWPRRCWCPPTSPAAGRGGAGGH